MKAIDALTDCDDALITIHTHFGEPAQVEKLLEEMGELGERLHKYSCLHKSGQGPDITHPNIVDEMADLLVVAHGLLEAHAELNDAVAGRIYFKVQRTLCRIETGYYV